MVRKLQKTPVKRTRKTPTKTDSGLFICLVSGVSYEAGVSKRFPVKPVKRRDRGLGYQMQYELTAEQARQLVDLMTDMQAPEEGDAEERVVLAVARDLSKFPSEVQPR